MCRRMMSGAIGNGDRRRPYSEGRFFLFDNIFPCTPKMADARMNVKVLLLCVLDPAVVERVDGGDGVATGTTVGEVLVRLIEGENRGHFRISE